MSAFIGEYQGKPVIELYEDRTDGKPDRFPVSMGLAKAKKLLANLDKLQNFVASEGKSLDNVAAPTGPELVETDSVS